MRFLQGSGAEGMGGIKCRRRKFIRPLLDISRAEIESYLIGKNQDWRTDATNFDTKYLRNKVRNRLVPVLNENFPGWQGAVLSGAKKSSDDEEFLHGAAESQIRHEFDALRAKQIQADDKKKICFARESFFSLEPAIQRRVFFSALNEIGFGGRFPFPVFEEVASWEHEKSREISFENVKITLDSEKISFSARDSHSSCGKTEIEGGFSFLFRKEYIRCMT